MWRPDEWVSTGCGHVAKMVLSLGSRVGEGARVGGTQEEMKEEQNVTTIIFFSYTYIYVFVFIFFFCLHPQRFLVLCVCERELGCSGCDNINNKMIVIFEIIHYFRVKRAPTSFFTP